MRGPPAEDADVPGAAPPEFLSNEARPAFQDALLSWFRRSGRVLRIRSTREPWAVLVSEVMAQQTQISRVDEVWSGFMATFPTPKALAEASTFDVLSAWQGLGYNRRAVALQRAARVIVDQHGGQVPDAIDGLEALPGVGPYTARAVAALAFGCRVAAVDTNVRRVIGRLCGVEPAPRELQAIADDLVAADDPAAWTHATMELGATLCRARAADCGSCPVRAWCASADAVAAASAQRRATMPPFEQSTRWLRGRIVARLRERPQGVWTALPGSIGSHGPERVAAAVTALRREGLLEWREDGTVRLPSSQR